MWIFCFRTEQSKCISGLKSIVFEWPMLTYARESWIFVNWPITGQEIVNSNRSIVYLEVPYDHPYVLIVSNTERHKPKNKLMCEFQSQ